MSSAPRRMVVISRLISRTFVLSGETHVVVVVVLTNCQTQVSIKRISFRWSSVIFISFQDGCGGPYPLVLIQGELWEVTPRNFCTMPSTSSGQEAAAGKLDNTTPPLGEVQNNANNYEELSLIGTGAYGTVYRARDRANNGQIVALKKVRIPLVDDGLPMNTLREISLLKQLEHYEHPNIVR